MTSFLTAEILWSLAVIVLVPAVIVGAPGNNLNAWVLGFEDGRGGGDTDHNDLIFIIERETGGTAELLPAAAITPAQALRSTTVRIVCQGVAPRASEASRRPSGTARMTSWATAMMMGNTITASTTPPARIP